MIRNMPLSTDCRPLGNSSVEMILLEDGTIRYTAIERSIKNLILLVLAIIIVVALWRAVWFLAGLAIFIALVYFVYLLLKGEL